MKASHPYHVIQAPILTEESMIQSETHNKYIFKVDPRANKKEIREAVEEHFDVDVVSVNTMNCLGKMGSQRMRGTSGRRSSWNKAIVTLREGQSIDLI